MKLSVDFFWASEEFGADVIVRNTGDCLLVDAAVIDAMIEVFISSNVDYLSSRQPPTFQDGLDEEVFSKSLKKV